MAKVLVTGGAGFIGSHVAEAYIERGDEVVVLDNLSSGKRENVPAEADFLEMDIRDDAVGEIIRNGGFDTINHHAAQMDVRVSVADPRLDAAINLDGLLNILEGARHSNVSKVLFVSSGGVVYGEPEHRPTPETAPKLPESPYGVTKLTGEHYLYYYHKVHGLDYAAMRYSNVYGPRQDPHGEAGVVAIFSTKLGRNEPMKVFGEGSQTRDYVFVGDVVRANMILSDHQQPASTTLDDRGFNVGTGRETSVLELAEILAGAAGRPLEVLHEAARPGELQRSSLDASKIRSLGWDVGTPLEDGLAITYDYIQKHSTR